tara:strand:+ start:1386 stop:2225 length:840 start_codon:yes stop_codon:yes gene_type:complete
MAVVFHFNGHAEPKYPKGDIDILKQKVKDASLNTYDLEDCELLTFDNAFHHYTLLECTDRLKLPIVNLGEDKYYKPLIDKYKLNSEEKWYGNLTAKKKMKDGFTLTHKILAVYDYLKNNKSKKYFYFFDQSDVYITGDLQKKIKVLEERNCKLLFNAETKCMYWPMAIRSNPIYPDINKFFINYGDLKRFEQDTYSPTAHESNGKQFLFLNSGAYLADTDFFVSFFDKYINFFMEFIDVNDQTIMHHFHFMYYPDIQVDHKCEIFQCMGPNVVEFNYEK